MKLLPTYSSMSHSPNYKWVQIVIHRYSESTLRNLWRALRGRTPFDVYSWVHKDSTGFYVTLVDSLFESKGIFKHYMQGHAPYSIGDHL